MGHHPGHRVPVGQFTGSISTAGWVLIIVFVIIVIIFLYFMFWKKSKWSKI